MKRFLIIATVLLWASAAFAQEQAIPLRLEVAKIEDNSGNRALELFNMPKDGADNYFLSVGHLGIGTDIVQIEFDPIFELFIPLGSTVSEALESMDRLLGYYDLDNGESVEITGIFAPLLPTEPEETIKVTHRQVLLSNLLEFGMEKQGYVRANYVPKSRLRSLKSSLKFYSKLYPGK